MFLKRYGVLLVFLRLALFTVASCTESTQESRDTTTYTGIIPASVLSQYQSCTSDDDCTFVNNGCCDCANGGEEAAINASNEDAFNARFDCDDITCTGVARVPPCGSGTVSCVYGKCSYSVETASTSPGTGGRIGSSNTVPLPANTLANYQSCTSDDDCIFVNNGCCDCANGGEEATINKNYVDEFNGEFDCEGIACTEVARLKPCGCGTVSCTNRLCVYSMDGC